MKLISRISDAFKAGVQVFNAKGVVAVVELDDLREVYDTLKAMNDTIVTWHEDFHNAMDRGDPQQAAQLSQKTRDLARDMVAAINGLDPEVRSVIVACATTEQAIHEASQTALTAIACADETVQGTVAVRLH